MLRDSGSLALDKTEPDIAGLIDEVRAWRGFGRETAESSLGGVPVFVNEFWTAKQRAAHPLHEISYRACFKPQLPAFFIERLTRPGEVVYDPFMGRGTTLIEALLRGRVPYGGDVNPLSRILVEPRLDPPDPLAVARRLGKIDLARAVDVDDRLFVFYHPETLRQITNLRSYLISRERECELDSLDRWIRMVATSRLTGHSSGFFSVYTMPPNQAVSMEVQRKINEKRNQSPPRRDVSSIILKKTRSLLRNHAALRPGERLLRKECRRAAKLFTGRACRTPQIGGGEVSLIVTSPPFLDTVDYYADNWLRCWFNGIDMSGLEITITRSLEDWVAFIRAAFEEFSRILMPGGVICFEVGEVRGGKLRLEEAVLAAARLLPLSPVCVVVNAQGFTKTSNCWGVRNNERGTNSNRIVVFTKPFP